MDLTHQMAGWVPLDTHHPDTQAPTQRSTMVKCVENLSYYRTKFVEMVSIEHLTANDFAKSRRIFAKVNSIRAFLTELAGA